MNPEGSHHRGRSHRSHVCSPRTETDGRLFAVDGNVDEPFVAVDCRDDVHEPVVWQARHQLEASQAASWSATRGPISLAASAMRPVPLHTVPGHRHRGLQMHHRSCRSDIVAARLRPVYFQVVISRRPTIVGARKIFSSRVPLLHFEWRATTRSDVAGSEMSVTPKPDNASTMALMMAAGAPTLPASLPPSLPTDWSSPESARPPKQWEEYFSRAACSNRKMIRSRAGRSRRHRQSPPSGRHPGPARPSHEVGPPA